MRWQVPDMFVNLKIGDTRVSYRRFAMRDREIHHSMEKMDTGDAATGGEIAGQGSKWVDLKRDMVEGPTISHES